MGNFKLQSAMEYLMTYGWAILIIAVVLGALFGLGVFNAGFLTPKVGPGACQIERPNGPGTSAHASAQGECTNGEPDQVAVFNPLSNSYVEATGVISGSSSGTISFWIDPKSTQPSGGSGVFSFAGGNYIGFGSGGFGVDGSGYTGTSTLSNTWSFVAVTFNGIVYVNGQQVYYGGGSLSPNPTIYIGDIGGASGTTFNGMISNVQYYNATLSPAEVLAMYHSGIGVVPSVVGSLVGWWPLNGNPNDYSGNDQNGQNGASVGPVVYTNAWQSEYTAP